MQFSFSSAAPVEVPQPLSLDADEILRLAFLVKDPSHTGEGKAQPPHQVFAVVSDEADPSVQVAHVIPVKRSTGKASFSLVS